MFAAACACGGSSRAPAASGDQLGAIRITGNRAIASDELEAALALHEAIGEGASVDPYLLGLDTARIRAAYLRRGFFAVTVTPAVEQRGGRQVVTFSVVEGRRAVSRVKITGLPPEVAPAAAGAAVGLGDGAPFDYDTYDAAKQPLTDLLENAGYAHARVTGAVTAEPGGATAAVRYTVEPGPRCTFGQIRIPPLAPDLAEAVRTRLRFATGDRYSAAALVAAQLELTQLGRFSLAKVAADPASDGPVVDVVVELAPATRREVHLGGGAGYEPLTYELRAIAGGSLVPEAHPLITMAVDGRVAAIFPHGATADGAPVQPKVRLLLSLQRIDLGWPGLRGESEIGYDYQVVEAYTWTGPHIRLGLGAPLGPRWLQARIGWLLEQLFFSHKDEALDISAQAQLGLDGPQRLGAYQASLVADLRDNPIEPHRGVYAAVTAAVGTPYAAGELSYQQITPELRGYVSLGETVFAIRARAGQIYGSEIPVTERYFSGGAAQRGFSDRQLAPRLIAGAGCSDVGSKAVVIGGAGLFETGIELRRPFASLWGFPVGTNLFLDGADVTCQARSFVPRNLRWAVGGGLWWKPYGLKVRGEIGYRINRMDDLSGGSSAFGNYAWHLGIGESF